MLTYQTPLFFLLGTAIRCGTYLECLVYTSVYLPPFSHKGTDILNFCPLDQVPKSFRTPTSGTRLPFLPIDPPGTHPKNSTSTIRERKGPPTKYPYKGSIVRSLFTGALYTLRNTNTIWTIFFSILFFLFVLCTYRHKSDNGSRRRLHLKREGRLCMYGPVIILTYKTKQTLNSKSFDNRSRHSRLKTLSLTISYISNVKIIFCDFQNILKKSPFGSTKLPTSLLPSIRHVRRESSYSSLF